MTTHKQVSSLPHASHLSPNTSELAFQINSSATKKWFYYRVALDTPIFSIPIFTSSSSVLFSPVPFLPCTSDTECQGSWETTGMTELIWSQRTCPTDRDCCRGRDQEGWGLQAGGQRSLSGGCTAGSWVTGVGWFVCCLSIISAIK